MNKDKKRLYLATLNERNGEYEYRHRFLIQCEEGREDDELEQIAAEFYGDMKWDENFECYWHNWEITVKNGGAEIVPEEHEEVVHQYFNLLSSEVFK